MNNFLVFKLIYNLVNIMINYFYFLNLVTISLTICIYPFKTGVAKRGGARGPACSLQEITRGGFPYLTRQPI